MIARRDFQQFIAAREKKRLGTEEVLANFGLDEQLEHARSSQVCPDK